MTDTSDFPDEPHGSYADAYVGLVADALTRKRLYAFSAWCLGLALAHKAGTVESVSPWPEAVLLVGAGLCLGLATPLGDRI